jgi:predicted helicase
MKYQMNQIFPECSSDNLVICVPGIGSKKLFSVLMTDIMPDLGFSEACQCFPRYQYPKPTGTPVSSDTLLDIDDPPDRIDNISDTALKAFQEQYSDESITKDDIFDYVYGILHAPSYREQFANDLSKMLPRIPYAPDFRAFAEAGKKLADLHLNYETCEKYPLTVEFPNIIHQADDNPELYKLTNKPMKIVDNQKRVLAINDNVHLSGIPEESWRYVVNGRTPLGWFMDRYYIKTDKDSGIVNDPNGWFEDPRDIVAAIQRIIYVSVESVRIIDGLPDEITEE